MTCWPRHPITWLADPPDEHGILSKKAVAAIIAAEIMKKVRLTSNMATIPQYPVWSLPDQYEENLSEMVTPERFYYSVLLFFSCQCSTLEKIVGYGSSPVVNYPGRGIYFSIRYKKAFGVLKYIPCVVDG